MFFDCVKEIEIVKFITESKNFFSCLYCSKRNGAYVKLCQLCKGRAYDRNFVIYRFF